MTSHPIAVLILFFERAEQTIRCIESFLPSGVPIHVLDNGSSEASRAVLDAAVGDHPTVHVTDAGANLGVAVGRNRQIEATTEPWLFFVDNDIRMETADWVAGIRTHIEAAPDIEAWIPRQRQVPQGGYVRYKPLVVDGERVRRVKDPENDDTNAFPGGAAVVARALFERLGTYDEALFIGHEDYELALRGLLSGAPVRARQIDDVQLVHEHRMAEVEADRDAARTRYASEVLMRSAAHVQAKHGVQMALGDDEAWSRTQRDLFLEGRMPWKWRSPFRKLRHRIKALFRRGR